MKILILFLYKIKGASNCGYTLSQKISLYLVQVLLLSYFAKTWKTIPFVTYKFLVPEKKDC